jgi:hypothetical protein
MLYPAGSSFFFEFRGLGRVVQRLGRLLDTRKRASRVRVFVHVYRDDSRLVQTRFKMSYIGYDEHTAARRSVELHIRSPFE